MLQVEDNPAIPLYRRIHRAICDALADGRLAPGDKLPARVALAEELGVNLASIRDAYKALEQQRIVTSRRGDGTYIRPDALHQIQVSRRRRIEVLVMVLGVPSLAHCPRAASFISADILAGVYEVLGEWETRVIFAESLDRPWVKDLGPDSAIILRTPREVDSDLIRRLLDRGIPIVSAWDRAQRPVPHVTYDRSNAAAMACRHLIDCGYRRIGFLGRTTADESSGSKFAAFSATMLEAGIDLHARYVREIRGEAGRAYRIAQELIEAGDLPEAFFVDTDYKAMEVITALHDAGLKVPDDIGIAGYDDTVESASFEPPLTTVRVPRREIGRRVAQMMIDWPRSGYAPEAMPPNAVLSAEMVVRGTTCDRVNRSGESGGVLVAGTAAP